ncbi:MAG: FMN-binding protein, partial [Pirellulaceae bacterium]|nr:FMN-binding protein [Pirellulaceae bacterium]
MHAIRLSVLIALLVGLHQLAGRHRSHSSLSAPDLVTIQRLLPKAAAVTETQAQPTLWEVTDQSGQALALVGLTSPMADNIVGYAGPNNVLLLLDNTGSVTSAELLGSSDTLDHVERVRQSSSFWQQFQGRQIGDNSAPHVDGVSGATLTSLAIAEAINLRLSGKRLNLRFPEEPTLDEAQTIYPLATSLQPDPSRTGLYRVSDLSQATIGYLLRTGPLVDDTIGYQGPTELLVAFDNENRITKIRMRRSYDNEPYVRYTRMEASFWSKFVGRTWEELSRIDLDAEGIEGVSGATMTSMAVAESLRLAAQRHLKESASDSSNAAGESSGKFLNILSVRRWNWSIGEIATAAIALLVMPWSMSRMRGQRHLRTLWQVIVLVVIVGLSGNLISLALLAGWT